MTLDQAIQKEIALYVDACRCAVASKQMIRGEIGQRAYAHWHYRAHIHLLALGRLRGYKCRQETSYDYG